MRLSESGATPLLIEWSPGRVRLFDTATRTSKHGATISECVDPEHRGSNAVVAISHQSVFIRAVKVPLANRDDVSRILANMLPPLLPLNPGEYTFGFRLASETSAGGRLAVVAAVKTESLYKLYDEGKERDLKFRLVTPLAFGSWMASKTISAPNCVVVQVIGESITMDVITAGELQYSRSIAAPEDRTEIQDEIARTLVVAESPPVPVLGMASPEIDADLVDSKEAIEYLGDPAADKLLFTLTPPDREEPRTAQQDRRVALRAQIAFLLAALFAVYVFRFRLPAQGGTGPAAGTAAEEKAQTELKSSKDKLAGLQSEVKVLDSVFQPSQTFVDILTVLSSTAPPEAWFTGFTLSRTAPLVISGQATSDAAVANYERTLSGFDRFKGVKVLFANKAMIDKRPIVEFSISGHAVGLLPIEMLLKDQKS